MNDQYNPNPVGFSKIFKSITKDGTEGSWITSPLLYSYSDTVEVLYDETTRLPPIWVIEPIIANEETQQTVDLNKGLMNFNLTIDLHSLPMSYKTGAGNVMNQQLQNLHLFLISDDPNLHVDSAWEMHWAADLYYDN